MDEIESQIAKISLGNTKSSNTYVYTMAENAPTGTAELYVVAELPLFNPAAEESCERICLAIGSTLKRAYRSGSQNEATFENAISQINEELGKLASMGQTNWISKLNCILAAKEGNDFHIASCGKVSAYMLRLGEFTDISCSPEESHPLKTFESFASGKLRLGDLLLLSTTQLFNFLSMDRILNILENTSFLAATQTIIQLLKDSSDNQTSFGVLLNLQVQPGQVEEENVDLENYELEEPKKTNFFQKAIVYIQTIFAMDRSAARIPKTELPKISFGDRVKNISGGTKNFIEKIKTAWLAVKNITGNIIKNFSKDNLKNLSPIKKFFFASLAFLLIAVISSITIAIKVGKNNKVLVEISSQMSQAQTLLDSAQSSMLYKEYNAAGSYISQAKALLPKAENVPASNKEQYNNLISQINSQEQQMERVANVEVVNLGSLGSGNRLIRLPNYIAVQGANAIISLNIATGQIQDSQLSAGVSVVGSTYINNNNAAVYDGTNLYFWDFSASKLSPGFSQSMPDKDSFAGMSFYQTNNRVYVLDKKNSRIVSFLASTNGFSKPLVSLNNPVLLNAQDITLDGAIYVLTNSGVSKFQSGNLAEYNFPQLPTAFSGTGKIYTAKDFKNVYILDSGNNRIIVTDKTGNLIYSIKSELFTKLSDFVVNEAGKTIYLLNDGSLLKATLP
jgi:hypothetical protein